MMESEHFDIPLPDFSGSEPRAHAPVPSAASAPAVPSDGVVTAAADAASVDAGAGPIAAGVYKATAVNEMGTVAGESDAHQDGDANEAGDELEADDVYEEEEDAEADPQALAARRQRSAGVVAIVGIVTVIGTMIFINSFPDSSTLRAGSFAMDSVEHQVPPVSAPALLLSHMRVVDTLYTTDSVYLDVNLTRQNVTVHMRNGGQRTFLISSGTPAVREGMATPTGLFTIQSMQPMAISKQFNDARLHHWIGIQGGVGFHGLDGSGYYWNLGKRPSSHGCVRMSREQIADMYKLVHPGAPIMVHYGFPARVVAFCEVKDTADADLVDSVSVYDRALGRDRMHTLYSGDYWLSSHRRFVHLANQRVRWGLEIGDSRRLPQQRVPPTSYLTNYIRMKRTPRQSDRTFAPMFRDGEYGDLVRATDSLKAERHREAKQTENEVQFGE